MTTRRIRPAGEVRQSQVLTTYGPGAMIDLPHHSVIIGGLELWQGERERVSEPRLERWIAERFGVGEVKLYAPPVDGDDGGASRGRTGIPAFQFPTWFLGQVDETFTADGRLYRTRPLLSFQRLVRGGYLDKDRKQRAVVPVRFVQACVRGHISDVDWFAFVLRSASAPTSGDLWLDEGGAGNDFADIFVRHEQTGDRRALADARNLQQATLGRCKGKRPWLGPRIEKEVCAEPNRLLMRSASNAYFAQTMSVISIPDRDEALREAVDAVWDDHLAYADDARDVTRERRRERVAAALEGFADDAVWAEIERRRRSDLGAEEGLPGIKEVEIATLSSGRATLGEDKPDGDFFARVHPLEAAGMPALAAGKIERLVLVDRLREVTAQIGFTRFEAPTTDLGGELDAGVEMAKLGREPGWFPACQLRGEGVFVGVSAAAIREWLARPGVVARGVELKRSFEQWRQKSGRDNAEFAGLPYIMLHSLAHLLVTTLSLDCGYSASAIRERVYAGESGYGILLHTGSPGAEGTLGGLVDVGKNLGIHLERALELGRLCSNDPVCAQHAPGNAHVPRYLLGAACHGCLLIAETSCERRNELLDRALVVPTVATADAAFFVGEAAALGGEAAAPGGEAAAPGDA